MIDEHIFSGITGFSSSIPVLYFLLGVVVNMELTTLKIYYTNKDEIVTTNKNYSYWGASQACYAEVAELVDALGSGSSGRTPVGVRVPASAPVISRG
jgi:hypothetical protein